MQKCQHTHTLNDGPDWTFELLTQYEQEIDRVAKLYGLDIYPNQIEIIIRQEIHPVRAALSSWANGVGL